VDVVRAPAGSGIREIEVARITDAVAAALERAASHLPDDYLTALAAAGERELTPIAADVIATLLENARYAESEAIPTCQDTGMAVLFVSVGQDVHLTGGDLRTALDEGVRRAYAGLRKSVVGDPLERVNTRDNTPAIVHIEIVPGDGVRIDALMKGFGAEMMSRSTMLSPSKGLAGVTAFVLDVVRAAGPNACPPLIVGVGIGGSFDSVGYHAKHALLRPLGTPNALPHLAALERELLDGINALGVGPQGFGGATTALAVHVEAAPTHIVAIPVAVNLNCSAPRRASVTL
jgi:fumarate hydratase subunit alpha